MLKRYIALAFAAVALTAAACGDDGGDADPGTSGEPSASGEQAAESSPTKAQFLKEASDICISEREKLAKEGLAFGERAADKDPNVLEHEYFPSLLLKVVVPSIRRQLAQLRELDLPSGEEQEAEEIFADLEKTIDDAAADPARGSDRFRQQFTAYSRRAAEYGLSNCVYP